MYAGRRFRTPPRTLIITYFKDEVKLLPGNGIAVYTAIHAIFPVGKTERLLKLRLGRGDAPWILAFDYIAYRLGKLEMLPLYKLSVTDDIHRNARIDIPDHVKIEVDHAVDLDYIFAAELGTVGILDYRDGTVKLIEVQNIVKLHTASCGNMVEHYTVCYRIDYHFTTALSHTSSSRRSISAILMYLP